MSTNLIRKKIQRIAAFPAYFKWYFSRGSHESVYFYTFHKCASTLFSLYVLKHINGLRHVNYAKQIYTGKSYKKIKFEEKGYIYGPIRLSADPMSPVYKELVIPASKAEFVRDKIIIFFVRDPRDILVSAYYSFGFTHGFSPVKDIREQQEVIKSEIQEKTLDEYALHSVDALSKHFKTLSDLDSVCERSVVLKYEDMISNFEYFIAQLYKYIDIDENVVQEIFERSRPKDKENTSSHRRSGRVGGFRSKLNEETIESLNKKLEGVLERFQYQA